ncbi:MAG: DUF502 domain-containing protein [Flavobacteriales bacterium]|nr:DUF502 domain-containing protein [Flavobacteriales bacterium]
MSITTRRLGRILLSYFLRGLLVLVPITITVWAIWSVFVFLDTIIETKIPGAGILLLLGIITVAGWLASTLLFKPLAELADETLQRVPFLKTLYGTLKDLVEAVVGNKKKFDRPVLVRLGAGMDAQRVGFITQDDLSHLGLGTDQVAVYLPHAFAWSGNLMIVPRINVTPLDARAADVMKFVLSGGVSRVDEEAA